MFRRARLSVKPNVRPVGRGGGPSAPAAPEPQRGQDSASLPARQEPQPSATASPGAAAGPHERTGCANDDGEARKPADTPLQRRKRISTMPNLAKPRVTLPSERPTQGRTTQEEMPHKKSPLTKDKQKCSDRERILKAQKLREMLKEELKKERMKRWKNRPTVIEGKTPPDHSKMTMRDLIYYLPENNPMKSSLAEEKKTEKTSTQEAETEPEEGEENDGPLLVPRVKVAEDGTIILDEESLTVEVLRTKGSCVVEENDPIFERGSTTTYSSFRKSFYTKPWSNKETDMFFLAISMVGTDFSLIGQLFPHRARTEIKNKFKREEKANGWRIDKAFKEKRPFDFEFFAQLLEEVLADEKKRKQKATKRQSSKEKKPHKSRKKQKAKVVSEDADNDQEDPQGIRISDAETEVDAGTAEKENEESLSVSEQTEEQIILEPVTTKKKRKKKKKDDSELEVENLAEEGAAPTKPAKGGKSSNKSKIKMLNHNPSFCCWHCPSLLCVILNFFAVNIISYCFCILRETEKAAAGKPSVRGRLQRPKPNLARASGKTEATVQEKSEVKISSSEPTEGAEKMVGSSNLSEIWDIVILNVCLFRSKEISCLQEGGKQSVLKPAPLMRARMQRPKPNVGRAAGRQEVSATKKDVEDEKMEVGEAVKSLIHCENKSGALLTTGVSFFHLSSNTSLQLHGHNSCGSL
uniref:Myb-like domain-containing protein n=1 Tax=Chrysemys picta bellii TaxID=8478 RepID=A0A8C3FX31_CHRPI